ncbi:MAG: glycerol-3-phosphate 1-O-acyltransferase PlsY [Clostridiaceae bacterium]|nr:glycerol-3-phosphate 1-O-acyltransferase PlsY [Clostridiaceae bacterium]
MVNTVVKLAVAAITGYLLGSINTSLVVGKFYKIDIRKHGSGNAGVTNTLRILGKTAALLVLAGDALKGILACLTGHFLAGETGTIIGGGFSILGHNWPVYFGLKGGKGVLTSFAVMVFTDWKLAMVTLAVFMVVVLLTRYVSLGSIVGAVALPVAAVLLNRDVKIIIFSVLLGLLVIMRHRSNIERLINGTESRLGRNQGDDVKR